MKDIVVSFWKPVVQQFFHRKNKLALATSKHNQWQKNGFPGKRGPRADSETVLQVCYISSVSVEVILASSSLEERKRDKDTLALSSMATTPKRMLLQVNLGTSRGPFSPKIKVTQVRVSYGLCPDSSFFILLISSPSSPIPPNFFFLIYLI